MPVVSESQKIMKRAIDSATNSLDETIEAYHDGYNDALLEIKDIIDIAVSDAYNGDCVFDFADQLIDVIDGMIDEKKS